MFGIRRLLLLLLYVLCVFTGYGTLLSVVPLWTVRVGGDDFAAGVSTGVYMAVTVLTQFGTPALLRRFGHRAVLSVGAVLLGVPVLLLPFVPSTTAVLLLSAVRGVGFGLTTVGGNALLGELVPSSRLGTASSLYGVAVGIPQLLGLPLGVYVAQEVGFVPVFVVAGVLPLVGALLTVTLPASVRNRRRKTELWSVRILVPPMLFMVAVASATGAVVSLLPLAAPGATGAVSTALFGVSAAMLVFRWLAGVVSDRVRRPGVALVLGMFVCVVGSLLVTVGVPDSASGIVLGATVLGAGFGLVQNDCLVMMFRAVDVSEYGAASAAWNIGYDTGSGVGAVVVGALAGLTGYSVAFAATAAVVLVAASFAAVRVVR